MMASKQHDTVFPEEDMDDDDDSQEDEEEEDDDDDVLHDDEENDPSPSTSSAALAVTVAVPASSLPNGDNAPISNPASATTVVVSAADSSPSDPKRQSVATEQIEEKKPLDDSRRLFQRLWTDEDEIELLQGFLDYTSQRGSSHHNDTALFYDQIKSKLQLDFNKNQLVEKIRRLKKKYRNVLNKIGSGKEFSFKSPHDQATFEISRKIWSNMGPIADNAIDDDEINLNPNPNPNPNLNYNFALSTPRTEALFGNSAEKKTPPSRKRSRPRSSAARTDEKREPNEGSVSHKDHNFTINATPTGTGAATTHTHTHNDNCNNSNMGNSGYSIPGLIEETVRSCLSPLLKELVGGAMGGPFGGRGFGGFSLNSMPLGLGVMNLGLGSRGEAVDEKWRRQQILELEVYSKRLELVQEQIKAALDELRSTGGG